MPIPPYRVAREALEPDGEPLVVYRIDDVPVAVRRDGGLFTVYENPFPADDAPHALTDELLDVLTARAPDEPRPPPRGGPTSSSASARGMRRASPAAPRCGN